MLNFKNIEKRIELDQIDSPFINHIKVYRSKSRNIRKKIYKYLQAKHHNYARQTYKTIKSHLQGKKLPQNIQQIQNLELKSVKTLQKLTIPNEVNLQLMKNIVSQQEKHILSIINHPYSTFKTAQKRRPLADITLIQSMDKKRLLLTTQNQLSPRLSLEGDFCSEASIFPQQKSQDELESLKLKENYSILQIQNIFSNISSSLFDEPAHGDVLNFN